MSINPKSNRSVEQITDELLVQRCQQGSSTALEALIHRWQEPLWRHVMRQINNPSLADDILQESLIAITKQIRKLDDPNRFRPWAYRIASNKTADFIRSKQRNEKLTQKAFAQREETSKSQNLDQPVDLLRAALKKLNDKDRLILSLFYLDEMTVAEVAEVCNIPTGTVKSRLSKARNSLKKILDTKFNTNT